MKDTWRNGQPPEVKQYYDLSKSKIVHEVIKNQPEHKMTQYTG